MWREQIINNRYIVFGGLFVIGLLAHLGIGLYKKTVKKQMLGKFTREATLETSDRYVSYYQRAQKIDFLRVVSRVVVASVFLYITNSGFLTGLAIGIGAIIITFGSFIVSLVYYFYLMSEFKIGQTVRVGEHRQGEIISFKPLYLGLSAKNNNGEHTGEYYLISNKMVREHVITKVDLQKTAIKKVLMNIPYHPGWYTISYDAFLERLSNFLHHLLPVYTPKSVGHYKSYIGYKYKMDVEMLDNGTTVLHLGFLDTIANQRKTKQKIVAFVEELKRNPEKDQQ